MFVAKAKNTGVMLYKCAIFTFLWSNEKSSKVIAVLENMVTQQLFVNWCRSSMVYEFCVFKWYSSEHIFQDLELGWF